MGSRVDYDAPGGWCTRLLYSTDGKRLFSCGTSKDGKSFLDEWNDTEGTIKRSYSGFRRKSAGFSGVVQFDTTQNLYIAAGEDNQIKFWKMDSNIIVTSTDAEGGLPARINRFSNHENTSSGQPVSTQCGKRVFTGKKVLTQPGLAPCQRIPSKSAKRVQCGERFSFFNWRTYSFFNRFPTFGYSM